MQLLTHSTHTVLHKWWPHENCYVSQVPSVIAAHSSCQTYNFVCYFYSTGSAVKNQSHYLSCTPCIQYSILFGREFPIYFLLKPFFNPKRGFLEFQGNLPRTVLCILNETDPAHSQRGVWYFPLSYPSITESVLLWESSPSSAFQYVWYMTLRMHFYKPLLNTPF